MVNKQSSREKWGKERKARGRYSSAVFGRGRWSKKQSGKSGKKKEKHVGGVAAQSSAVAGGNITPVPTPHMKLKISKESMWFGHKPMWEKASGKGIQIWELKHT